MWNLEASVLFYIAAWIQQLPATLNCVCVCVCSSACLCANALLNLNLISCRGRFDSQYLWATFCCFNPSGLGESWSWIASLKSHSVRVVLKNGTGLWPPGGDCICFLCLQSKTLYKLVSAGSRKCCPGGYNKKCRSENLPEIYLFKIWTNS